MISSFLLLTKTSWVSHDTDQYSKCPFGEEVLLNAGVNLAMHKVE